MAGILLYQLHVQNTIATTAALAFHFAKTETWLGSVRDRMVTSLLVPLFMLWSLGPKAHLEVTLGF